MEPIAIIGLSLKLPGRAEDESSLWELLESRRNVSSPWPQSRANTQGFHQPGSKRKNMLTSERAHFIQDDPAAFDAPFFSIPSKEAHSIDPQQRWLLEASYRAFENAGIPIENIAGTNTAVISGSMSNDYMNMFSKDPDDSPDHTATGTTNSILANRLSWYFDLKGPSIQVDTACSSSMTAMDLACKSLQSPQTSMALVAGCNVLLTPDRSIYLSNMGFLSPDGVSYSFDHRANGYGRGEGTVALVLKRLCDAVKDRDMIRAVIRGSGSNQDGRTPGLTQPSSTSQEELIRSVYQSSGLDYKKTRYVEAHGTGTQIGDTTEARVVGGIFRASRTPSQPLYIGSIKASVGHLEGASALASIAKCILILEKGIIAPNALFEQWNSKINAKALMLQVPTTSIPWPSTGLRRISVSSFGFGGSNSHIILDDAYHALKEFGLEGNHNTVIDPPPDHELLISQSGKVITSTNGDVNTSLVVSNNLEQNGYVKCHSHDQEEWAHKTLPVDQSSVTLPSTVSEHKPSNKDDAAHNHQDSSYKLLIWSAKDESALERLLNSHKEYFMQHVHADVDRFNRFSYTLSARRSRMPWKSCTVISSDESLQQATFSTFRSLRAAGGLCFVFTGQGAQYVDMGLQLVQYPVFKSTLVKADQAFRKFGAEWSLFDELQSGSNINSPEPSQPLCTALQIALVELFKTFGVSPDSVMGHSSGEIAAAFTMGALSLESACRVAYHRGRLAAKLASILAASDMDSDPSNGPGAMISVNIPEGQILEQLAKLQVEKRVCVACVNSPLNITLSGDEAAIDDLRRHFASSNIFCQKLQTGVAYHSPAMQQIAEEYLSCLDSLETQTASDEVLMVSSVTGQRITARILTRGQYWVDNLVSPVRFVDALQYMAVAASQTDGLKPISDYVEFGPHGALRRYIKDALGHVIGSQAFQYASVLTRRHSPVKTVLETVGHLFLRGFPASVTAANQSSDKSCSFVVDAPGYPFDHSRLFWHEGGHSRTWRMRDEPPHPLLGTRATDWNPLEPRWEMNLSVEKMPWLADHFVGGTALFPAAGSLMTAIEAVRQVANKQQKIVTYHVKEATFMNPIVIRPEAQTQVMAHLRPLQQTYEKTASRFNVQLISAGDAGNWNRCFDAIIHIEYEQSLSEVDGGYELRTATRYLTQSHARARDDSTKRIDSKMFYRRLQEQGLEYGRAFSLVEDLLWDGHQQSLAYINTKSAADKSLKGLAHPAVLDAAFQVCFAAPSEGLSRTLPTLVPHKINDLVLTASGLEKMQLKRIQCSAKSRLRSAELGVEGSVVMLDEDGTVLCHLKRLEMLPIMSVSCNTEVPKPDAYSIEWKPYLPLLDQWHLARYCCLSPQITNGLVDYNIQLEKTLRAVLRQTMPNLRTKDWSKAPTHMKAYLSWADDQLQDPHHKTENELESLVAELKAHERERPSWRLFIEAAKNLVSISQGAIDHTRVLDPGQALGDFYDSVVSRIEKPALKSYLDLLSHHSAEQEILEVGVGTGSMTRRILSLLHQTEQRIGGRAFSRYTSTDISGVSEDYVDSFKEYDDRMRFKSLDTQQDIVSQGFELGSYDLIVLGDGMHLSVNIHSALPQLRLLLKPGGHLIIFSLTAAYKSFVMGFGFGLLPGWWEETNGSLVQRSTTDDDAWDTILRSNEFSGSDLLVRDEATHCASIICTTAKTEPVKAASNSRMILVVGDDGDDNSQQLATASWLENITMELLGNQSEIFKISQLAEANPEHADYVVFLVDVGRPFLGDASDTTFALIKKWLELSNKILWVSGGGLQACSPHFSIHVGLLRTLRAEFDSRRTLASLSVEDETSDPVALAKHISKVLGYTLIATQSPAEVEYIVRDGQILTGRIVVDRETSRNLAPLAAAEPVVGSWLPGPPLILGIERRGQLEGLRFIEDTSISASELGPCEIEVETRAWALNFRDVFAAVGRMEFDSFGSDCAGIVTRVGHQCTSVQPGDRVCVFMFGCMRTYVRADEWCVYKIPDSISFEEACAVLSPAGTAIQSLIEIARMEKGDKVLIHAASGATGQLAIQLAQSVGAEVFATVGYDHKRDLLIKEYGIPSDHIFYSRDTTFAHGVMRMTQGRGVDVVLNSLVGQGLRMSSECMAPFGRFVEIGKADIISNAPLPMQFLAKNVSFAAVDLHHIFTDRKSLAKKILQQTMKLVYEGTIRSPQPLQIYDVDAVEEAFRCLQKGKTSGRVMVRVNPSTLVKKYLAQERSWQFDEDATYVVVGGFGGIGQSILTWMANKGAKHLLVLSRSGMNSKSAAAIVEPLVSQGIKILAPACDVSVLQSLSQVLQQCLQTMPPIRGCINAAMTLRDSVFENMTCSQWAEGIQSKVPTSWNLHTLLPDVDFFILLSSVSGIIGNPGQANYAAGCTFQDALARYRVKNGQNATSIDLGVMRSIGVVADNDSLRQRLHATQALSEIEEDKFLAILDICCRPRQRGDVAQPKSQVIMGIDMPSNIGSRSLEVPETLKRPLFAHFQQEAQANNKLNPKVLFKQLSSIEDRAKIAVELLTKKLARALSIVPEEVDVNKHLYLLGVDSLVAVELRNWMARDFAADVPVYDIMGGRSVSAIGELVAQVSQIRKE